MAEPSEEPDMTEFSDEPEMTELSEEPEIHIVRRHEWGAAKPKYTLPIEDPITTFRFHYTDTKECDNYMACTKTVQKLQKTHMKLGFPDIQYNFLVGGDGYVYEGAGWNNKVIDISHSALEADGVGPRIIIAYIAHRDKLSLSTVYLEKLGYDLINFGVKYNLIAGGPYKQDPFHWALTQNDVNPPPEYCEGGPGSED